MSNHLHDALYDRTAAPGSSTRTFTSSWPSARTRCAAGGRTSSRASRCAWSGSRLARTCSTNSSTSPRTRSRTASSRTSTTGRAPSSCPRSWRQAAACHRPKHFFREKGRCLPRSSSLLKLPDDFEAKEELLAELRRRIAEVEDACARERQQTGRRVLGRRGVLRQSWRDSPTSREPRRDLRPRVAARNKWLRIATLQRNKEWQAAYREARQRWKAGEAQRVSLRHLLAEAVCPRRREAPARTQLTRLPPPRRRLGSRVRATHAPSRRGLARTPRLT